MCPEIYESVVWFRSPAVRDLEIEFYLLTPRWGVSVSLLVERDLSGIATTCVVTYHLPDSPPRFLFPSSFSSSCFLTVDSIDWRQFPLAMSHCPHSRLTRSVTRSQRTRPCPAVETSTIAAVHRDDQVIDGFCRTRVSGRSRLTGPVRQHSL